MLLSHEGIKRVQAEQEREVPQHVEKGPKQAFLCVGVDRHVYRQRFRRREVEKREERMKKERCDGGKQRE